MNSTNNTDFFSRTRFRNSKPVEYVENDRGQTVGWIQYRALKGDWVVYLVGNARERYMVGDKDGCLSILNAIAREG